MSIKKLVLLIAGCLVFYAATLSQSPSTPFKTGFRKGFLEGYCYNMGLDCLAPEPPLAPLPNLNESQDSFQDGYNRGFQTGLDLRRAQGGSSIGGVLGNIPMPKFNDYVPQIPIDAYRDMMVYKQKLYDSRVQWIDDGIGCLNNLNYYYLSHNDPTSYEAMDVLMKEWSDNTRHLDLTNGYTFNTVIRNLKFFDNKIREEYNNAIKASREENLPQVNSNTTHAGGSDLRELNGVVSVFSYSPILDKPDFKLGKCIWKVADNSVTIINRANKDYYYVRKGNITGYLWVGWIKK